MTARVVCGGPHGEGHRFVPPAPPKEAEPRRLTHWIEKRDGGLYEVPCIELTPDVQRALAFYEKWGKAKKVREHRLYVEGEWHSVTTNCAETAGDARTVLILGGSAAPTDAPTGEKK